MDNLSDISVVKKLLQNHNFKFSKTLGQNFIINPSVCPEMAENAANSKDAAILEIGPGIGVLTAELAKRFEKVVSVEIDKKLIPLLSETAGEYENVKIINNDILKINLSELFKNEFEKFEEVAVCANLPYYITSDIIMYILENNPGFNRITVMVQKEAAERICAFPGTRKSGAISLAVRYYGEPSIIFDVKRGSFLPAPNVDSSVIKIEMNAKNSQNILNKSAFFKVVKAAYSKRRKNLLNSLGMGLCLPKDEISNLLKKSGVDASYRAEQLKFEDFVNISNNL